MTTYELHLALRSLAAHFHRDLGFHARGARDNHHSWIGAPPGNVADLLGPCPFRRCPVHPLEKIATVRFRSLQTEMKGHFLITSTHRQFSLMKCTTSVRSEPLAFFCIQQQSSRFLPIDAGQLVCPNSGRHNKLHLRKAS